MSTEVLYDWSSRSVRVVTVAGSGWSPAPWRAYENVRSGVLPSALLRPGSQIWVRRPSAS